MGVKKRKDKRRNKIMIGIIVLALAAPPLILGWTTPTPVGTSYSSPVSTVSGLQVIYDLTYMKENQLVHEQNILDEQIEMIRESEEFIVADLFLYNDYYNIEKYEFPKSTQKFTRALIEQKEKYQNLKVYLITDPINNSYGQEFNAQFKALQAAGIKVIITDLNQVRDSNPLYAGYYKSYFKHFGMTDKGWIKNPFGTNGPEVGVRNYLKLLNFKANHRKVLITDKEAMVSSSNPHDGSSYHSNIAFKFSGEAVGYLLESEKAVARFSGEKMEGIAYKDDQSMVREKTEAVILTEDKIKEKILEKIGGTKEGDHINLGMFYLSDREIIRQLIKASKRNVAVRIILDPNKDAFGYEKIGIPNRQVAEELVKKSADKIKIRWYLTHGEQYHTKVIGIFQKDKTIIIGGSANYTRRNLDNYNLESDIMLTLDKKDPIAVEFQAYFNKIWGNKEGVYTGDYTEYQESSLWKSVVYRIQEQTGLSTF